MTLGDKNLKLLLMGVLGTVLLVLGTYWMKGKKSSTADNIFYEKYIESINTKVEELSRRNTVLLMSIDSVNTAITKVDSELTAINTNITQIKQNSENEINTVNSFSVTDLQQFFTDRYK